MKEEYDFTDAKQGKFYRPMEELDIPTYPDKNATEYLSQPMQDDLNEVLRILKKYGVSRILLYGSVARGDCREESDIDICVEGLRNDSFFMALAECMMASEHSVSITDFKSTFGYFREQILKEGKIVYEQN
ncbi:MAG: nucleotidyltransferase family protein [Desulfococcaceae bacterium]